MLLAGTEAYHGILHGLAAVEEVRQGDVDRFSCSDDKATDNSRTEGNDKTVEESNANGPS